MHDDSEGCLDRNHRHWQSYGFHLAIASRHLRDPEGKGMGNLRLPERDALAYAAIHLLRTLTLQEAN